ncbi:MAG TPA: universal stress protein [Candidatus Limnocylindrales bacterium]|nr:universal stress protein [Candidatus Limnocylindrales bacterium]
MKETRVVAGVDGSDEALLAVQAATLDAARRGCGLKLVHAFVWPELRIPTGPPAGGPPQAGLRHEAARFLDDAAKVAAHADPRIPITTEVITGAPARVMLRQAHEAEVLVLGSRGLGGFTGLLVGSTAVQVAAHSPVPVLVIRSSVAPSGAEQEGAALGAAQAVAALGAERDGPVVLGVDGSPESTAAVAEGFAEADRRGAELLAVHTWNRPLVYDADDVEGEERRVLSEALSGYQGKSPDVKVTERVFQRRPAPTLVELSRTAQIVVVGSRGRGGFKGLLLGSVSQQLLHHAECPVLVVPRVSIVD